MRWNGIVRIASIPATIGVVAWLKYGLAMAWNVSVLIGSLFYITTAILIGIVWAMKDRRNVNRRGGNTRRNRRPD